MGEDTIIAELKRRIEAEPDNETWPAELNRRLIRIHGACVKCKVKPRTVKQSLNDIDELQEYFKRFATEKFDLFNVFHREAMSKVNGIEGDRCRISSLSDCPFADTEWIAISDNEHCDTCTDWFQLTSGGVIERIAMPANQVNLSPDEINDLVAAGQNIAQLTGMPFNNAVNLIRQTLINAQPNNLQFQAMQQLNIDTNAVQQSGSGGVSPELECNNCGCAINSDNAVQCGDCQQYYCSLSSFQITGNCINEHECNEPDTCGQCHGEAPLNTQDDCYHCGILMCSICRDTHTNLCEMKDD